MTTVAIIAQGAMGAGMGQRLSQHGVDVLTWLEGRSAASAERAAKAGMRAVDAAGIAGADIILSVLPPAEALGLAEKLASAMRAATRKPLYADCNAISPAQAERIGAVVTATGARFADGGIIGAPPREGYTPKLYVSGEHAPALLALNEKGFDVRLVEGPVGAASALKLCYAGITKGLTALGSAMALAATRNGAAAALAQELAASQPNLVPWFDRFISMMYDKAYRWDGEMEEIADFIGRDRAEARMYEGAAGLYRHIAADHAGDGTDVAALKAFLALNRK